MKKLLFFAAAAAVMFSSCSKDQTEVVPVENVKGGLRIKATMVEDGTRTYLDNSTYKWSKGDALGVYVYDGENNAKNVAFTLDPVYDGQTSGEFVSNNKNLLDATEETFFAYYPHTPGMGAVESVEDLKLQVLQQQNYQPGTFSTLSAPSVCDNFQLDETVTMQPVADYLKVWVKGIGDIEYMTLAINYGGRIMDDGNIEGGSWIKLHGAENLTLKSYTLENKTRYALTPRDMSHPGGDNEIQLNCGRLDETVVCHHANEYVFVVPAGLLRSQPAEGGVYVRLGINRSLADAYLDLGNYGVNWFQFDMTGKRGMTLGDAQAKLTAGSSDIQLENTLHNLNTQDNPIVYNPEKDFIISSQLDFLQYMNEYGVDPEYGGIGNVDAFVCGPMEDERNAATPHQAKFDFTPEKIGELITSFKGETAQKEKLNSYLSDYVAEGIPCIEEFQNEFKGNGAEFKAIKGLQSAKGMFGDLIEGAKIENFKLTDIKGKNSNANDAILANSIDNESSLVNITIENASKAESILNNGDVDNFLAIEVLGENTLKNIINNFSLEKYLNFDVDPVDYPVEKLFGNTAAVGGHNVITVEESADAAATYGRFGTISTTSGSEVNCVSVVINNESWWTGDTVATATDGSDTDDYVEIWYAEQLQNQYDSDAIELMRPMNMQNKAWKTIEYVTVEGNNAANTISNISMESTGASAEEIAPFAIDNAYNLTINGVNIKLVSDAVAKTKTIAEKIAGLSIEASYLKNVVINKLTLNATGANAGGAFDDSTIYYDKVPNIGWAVVSSDDGKFENVAVNEITSNVKGEAGTIHTINLTQNSEAQVINVAANITKKEQSDLTATAVEYKAANHKNNAGTPVFKVTNSQGIARSIKFTNCGAPCMTIALSNGGQINVYNGSEYLGTAYVQGGFKFNKKD